MNVETINSVLVRNLRMVLRSISLAHFSGFCIVVIEVDHNNCAEVLVGSSTTSRGSQELFDELLLKLCLNDTEIEIVLVISQLLVDVNIKVLIDIHNICRQGSLGSFLRCHLWTTLSKGSLQHLDLLILFLQLLCHFCGSSTSRSCLHFQSLLFLIKVLPVFSLDVCLKFE